MSNTSAANVSRGNDLSLSNTPPSIAEGIALCVAFTSTFVLTVAGNLLTIIIFANKNIHKNHFSLVVNMVFVVLSLENVSLLTFTYHVGFELRPWTRWIGTEKANKPLYIFFMIFDTFFSQASLASAAFISCERFHAIYWPVKHRALSTEYTESLFLQFGYSLSLSLPPRLHQTFFFLKNTPCSFGGHIYTLILLSITCGCNLGIWKKFQSETFASLQQQTRDLQNKRLTDILSLVSGLTLLT